MHHRETQYINREGARLRANARLDPLPLMLGFVTGRDRHGARSG
ncbi:MAG: hypothetical protein ACOCVS_01920 [Planctomycetota bacterium]